MANGPRKKLVDRFEVLGVRTLADPMDEPWEPQPYQGVVDQTLVRIVTLHYETHIDARLGATGLRVGGYRIFGIRDLHTNELVDASEVTRGELR